VDIFNIISMIAWVQNEACLVWGMIVN